MTKFLPRKKLPIWFLGFMFNGAHHINSGLLARRMKPPSGKRLPRPASSSLGVFSLQLFGLNSFLKKKKTERDEYEEKLTAGRNQQTKASCVQSEVRRKNRKRLSSRAYSFNEWWVVLSFGKSLPCRLPNWLTTTRPSKMGLCIRNSINFPGLLEDQCSEKSAPLRHELQMLGSYFFFFVDSVLLHLELKPQKFCLLGTTWHTGGKKSDTVERGVKLSPTSWPAAVKFMHRFRVL